MEKKVRELTLKEQIENIPEAKKQEGRNAYNSGEISASELQESWIDAGYMTRGYNQTKNFIRVIAKYGFKQYQSHGFLAESEEHMRLWDWAKNDSEGIFPDKLTLKSAKKAFFKCGAGLHPSEKRMIYNHVAGHGCSKCAYEVSIPAMNEAWSTPKLGESLAELMPEIAEQYMDWLNDRPATMIKPKVDDDAWWMPPCGKHNEYKMRVDNRTKLPANYCPYCDMASEYERYWYDLVSDFLNPLGIKVFANQNILEPNKDMELLSPGIPQGPQIDIWIPYLNYGIEINTKGRHDKEKGTKECPLGYERNKSLRAMIQRVYLDHVWQVDHEANPEQEEARILNSLKVAMHQKGMPIAVDWEYSGDWGESA